MEVYLGCSYNDFITICFIIGGNYSWKHTIKENIYKACKCKALIRMVEKNK